MIGTAAKAASSKQRFQALAARGYSTGPAIKACTETDITPIVPGPMAFNAGAERPLQQSRLHLHRQRHEYCSRCPWYNLLRRSNHAADKDMIQSSCCSHQDCLTLQVRDRPRLSSRQITRSSRHGMPAKATTPGLPSIRATQLLNRVTSPSAGRLEPELFPLCSVKRLLNS
jgi:hypothetical protein